MSPNTNAIFTIFGLMLSAVFAAPLLDTHPMHKRDLRSDIAAADVRIKIVPEGHTIELDCDAVGPAPPVIHWLKNGHHVEQGPLDHFAENLLVPAPEGGNAEDSDHSTMSTLLIKNASPTDAGKYTCVADTVSSRQARSFDVRITASASTRAQPNKRTLSNDVRIYLWSDSVFEDENVNSRLICRATQGPDKPAPQIRWLIDGAYVTDNTTGMRIHRNGDLEFRSTADLHLAEIKCIAIGTEGNEDVKEPFLYIYPPAEL